MKAERYDIVIAGGGMIGTSLALALAPLGLRVAVVEAGCSAAEFRRSFHGVVAQHPAHVRGHGSVE